MSSRAKAVDVVVIGGGVGGTAASIELARSGLTTVVVESRVSMGRDHWGFVLWPFGTRVLRWLDVFDQVTRSACLLERFRWFSSTGKELASARVDEHGVFVGVQPSVVEGALVDRARQVGTEYLVGCRWTHVGLIDGRRVVDVEDGSGDRVRYAARVVVGADGPGSKLRSAMGLRSRRWRPPGQAIVTGLGPPAGSAASEQTMGPGWSIGKVDLGEDCSWTYAVVRGAGDGTGPIGGRPGPEGMAGPVREWMAAVPEARVVRPWSVRVPAWTAEGVVLMGDAAHGLLPHLGLGGSLTLAEVPALTEVVRRAVVTGDNRAARLAEFQRRVGPKVRYARRICELFGLATTARGMGWARDANLARLQRKDRSLSNFLDELAGPGIPALPIRLAVLLP